LRLKEVADSQRGGTPFNELQRQSICVDRKQVRQGTIKIDTHTQITTVRGEGEAEGQYIGFNALKSRGCAHLRAKADLTALDGEYLSVVLQKPKWVGLPWITAAAWYGIQSLCEPGEFPIFLQKEAQNRE
jgi:hypothetical protein